MQTLSLHHSHSIYTSSSWIQPLRHQTSCCHYDPRNTLDAINANAQVPSKLFPNLLSLDLALSTTSIFSHADLRLVDMTMTGQSRTYGGYSQYTTYFPCDSGPAATEFTRSQEPTFSHVSQAHSSSSLEGSRKLTSGVYP